MHDVVAQKITEINGNQNNKIYLEDIVTKLVGSVPKRNSVKAQLFRKARTILENFEILTRNAVKYNSSIYKLLQLNAQLMMQYVNSVDYLNVEKVMNWFNENDQNGAGKFNLWSMNDDEKYAYALCLQVIAWQYAVNWSNYRVAINYCTRAKEILDTIKRL